MRLLAFFKHFIDNLSLQKQCRQLSQCVYHVTVRLFNEYKQTKHVLVGHMEGGPCAPPPRTHVNITFFHPWDVLKTIFDVNIVENAACDLERSPKVNFCKNAPIMFKLDTKLNKNHINTNMQK